MKTAIYSVSVILLGGIIWLGCGEVEDVRWDGGGSAESTGVDGGAKEDGGASLPGIAGKWAMRQEMYYLTKVPVMKEMKTFVRTLILLDLSQQDEKITAKHQVCDLETGPPNKMMTTILPQKMIESIPPGTREATLKLEGGKPVLSFARTFFLLGMKMKDPANESMPKDKSDPRIFDQDEDGKPGVTVRVKGMVNAELYVVQRDMDVLRAADLSTSRINGKVVEYDMQQKVVDASHAMMKTTPEHRPDLSRQSTFVMVRLKDDVDCARLRKAADDLFR